MFKFKACFICQIDERNKYYKEEATAKLVSLPCDDEVENILCSWSVSRYVKTCVAIMIITMIRHLLLICYDFTRSLLI